MTTKALETFNSSSDRLPGALPAKTTQLNGTKPNDSERNS